MPIMYNFNFIRNLVWKKISCICKCIYRCYNYWSSLKKIKKKNANLFKMINMILISRNRCILRISFIFIKCAVNEIKTSLGNNDKFLFCLSVSMHSLLWQKSTDFSILYWHKRTIADNKMKNSIKLSEILMFLLTVRINWEKYL